MRSSFTSPSITAPFSERPRHPNHRHTHGNQYPCKIRCGANEGLCIRNDQDNVTYLYTDSLIGCTQVIFRNTTATFTCHIFTAAPDPLGWIEWAEGEFRSEYGSVTSCWVVTSDSPGVGETIYGLLSKSLKVEWIKNCGGCAIKITDATVIKTPTDWYVSRQDVGGWQTANELIDLRLRGSRSLGNVYVGDYSESCRECG